MKTILINEVKFWEKINRMEEKRDEHSRLSSEYIEMDEKITTALNLILSCEIVGGFSIDWENQDKTQN